MVYSQFITMGGPSATTLLPFVDNSSFKNSANSSLSGCTFYATLLSLRCFPPDLGLGRVALTTLIFMPTESSSIVLSGSTIEAFWPRFLLQQLFKRRIISKMTRNIITPIITNMVTFFPIFLQSLVSPHWKFQVPAPQHPEWQSSLIMHCCSKGRGQARAALQVVVSLQTLLQQSDKQSASQQHCSLFYNMLIINYNLSSQLRLQRAFSRSCHFNSLFFLFKRFLLLLFRDQVLIIRNCEKSIIDSFLKSNDEASSVVVPSGCCEKQTREQSHLSKSSPLSCHFVFNY